MLLLKNFDQKCLVSKKKSVFFCGQVSTNKGNKVLTGLEHYSFRAFYSSYPLQLMLICLFLLILVYLHTKTKKQNFWCMKLNKKFQKKKRKKIIYGDFKFLKSQNFEQNTEIL